MSNCAQTFNSRNKIHCRGIVEYVADWWRNLVLPGGGGTGTWTPPARLSTSDPLPVFDSRCVCLPAVYAGRFCTSFHWGGLYQCESYEEGGLGGGGVNRRGEACFCSPSRQDSVWSEPEPSQGALNYILRVFWFKANQPNHIYHRSARLKSPPPLKIQQTPALHLAFWLTAPYFPSLLLERAEKKEKKKSTTPGETEREEEKARRKTQEVEAREEKVI